jgi:hypothetical protein
MRDDDHRQPGASQPLQQPHQGALTRDVQAGEGFVEYQCPRRARKQSCQHHSTHLATAELAHSPSRQLGVQTDIGERRRYSVGVFR